MTPTAGSSRVRIVGGHLSAGIVSGTLFGFAYFLLEPVTGFWGRLEYLGVPLARILGVYLLFGMVVGVLAGLAVGGLCASANARSSPARYLPFYLAAFTFLIVSMYAVRNSTMAAVKAIPTSAEVIWYLVLLIGLTSAGFVLSRFLSKRGIFGRAGVRAGLIPVIVCVAAVGGAHGLATHYENRLPGDWAKMKASGPNVVFILLDALRADHVSAYGYHRDTTPGIDSLAREGVLFRNAHSHGNRTIISVPSIFTSLYPSLHGTVGRGKLIRPLGDDHTTMAELFREHGYRTVGVVPNVYLKRRYGLIQGFDKLENFYGERYGLGLYKMLRLLGVVGSPKYAFHNHADADEVTDAAVRWVERLRERPFFLYVHYMDTHHPYAPPPPYDTMYGARGGVIEPLALFGETVRLLKASRFVSLPEDHLAKLKDYYDGSIRFADDQIGRLLDEIKRVSGSRETVVVVTADHGDEFLEHGSLYHNNLVIEELIHVPLVFWSSTRFVRGSEVDCLVRHIDLLPTFADLIGAETAPKAMGESLVPLLEGAVDSIDVESIAEGDFCTSLNFENWKIVRVDSTDSYHLYDLSRVPLEEEDLSAVFPGVYARMRARLDGYLEEAKAVRKEREAEADEETIRELKALGYM